MIRNIVVAIIGLFIATSAFAVGPVFPPLLAGEYSFKVSLPAVTLDTDGVPNTTEAKSFGLINMIDPLAIIPGTCIDAVSDSITQISVTVPVLGDRGVLKAKSFEGVGCSGVESELSSNAAYVYFTGPASPTLSE